jgi:predicted permease
MARYQELPQIGQFYQELETRIGALPPVVAVGSAYGAPMSGWGSTGEVFVNGMPDPPPGEEPWAALRVVTPGYLDAQGIPLLRGRGVEATDAVGNLPVAVVNEAFVREHFPGQDPLGKGIRVTVDFGFGSPVRTIVGVVSDVRTVSLTRDYFPEVYVPNAQAGQTGMTVVVRLRPGSDFPLTAVREIVGSMDQGVPLRNVETMSQVMVGQTAATRFYLTLLAVFAGLAVILASVGLYGVMAYLVSIQRQEIGIRLALGAERVGMIRLVLAQAAAPIFVGLGGGLIAAAAGANLLERFLYQVDPRDPLVYGGVSLLLLVVAASSALIPARQAGRVDPGEALRED